MSAPMRTDPLSGFFPMVVGLYLLAPYGIVSTGTTADRAALRLGKRGAAAL